MKQDNTFISHINVHLCIYIFFIDVIALLNIKILQTYRLNYDIEHKHDIEHEHDIELDFFIKLF